ncbi:15381_t:CDS:2 [Racocetra fulgida]|uniref:15381_t:CDS:1 n=1 Tax=Racocetra fulgida TaxID=60492 RepID=A0A9N9F1U5_9GLOM|nr:15381_t:CDS:2 [Racocetra fulgida]
MNRLFGTSKKAPKPTLNDAIVATDGRVSAVEVKIKKLDGELAKYKDQMKKMREGPGKSQRDQLQQQSFNMEQASFTTENLRNVATTVDAMQLANKEMQKQYKKIDINKIESVQDDMEDLMEQANEIQETLGRTYGLPEDIDEEELEAELEALDDELNFEEEEEPSYLQETPELLNSGVDPLSKRYCTRSAIVISFKLCSSANARQSSRRAICPSSFTNSQITPTGLLKSLAVMVGLASERAVNARSCADIPVVVSAQINLI